jgi:cytochrome c553
MTELEIKAAVRERDGFRCTECGMTNEEHLRQYESSLEVHRVTPGSPYAVDESCITLCVPCHGPKPKRPRGSLPYGVVRLPEELVRMMKAIAAWRGVKFFDYLNDTARPLAEADFDEMVAANRPFRNWPPPGQPPP